MVATVHAALRKRRRQSARRGRTGTPAEIVLRLLVLKHVRNWSYAVLEREVRTNLVYRTFTRIGGGKVPDAKTMGKWGPVVGPQVVAQLHERLVAMARDARVMEGRRMRVDTGGRVEYSLPNRQQPVGRWRASPDAHHSGDLQTAFEPMG
jgi:IS5 family transposase